MRCYFRRPVRVSQARALECTLTELTSVSVGYVGTLELGHDGLYGVQNSKLIQNAECHGPQDEAGPKIRVDAAAPFKDDEVNFSAVEDVSGYKSNGATADNNNLEFAF